LHVLQVKGPAAGVQPEVKKIMKEAIILFTRIPVPGQTKTRLQSLLSPEECAKLHTCFLMDLRKCLNNTGKDCFVFYTPEGEKKQLIQILGLENSYCLQQGENLGERMANAISDVLGMGYNACILLGADIPQIQPEDLNEAFDVLKDRDIVFGPTLDNGYWLVGMKKCHRAVFQDQIYGYGNVLENTMDSINAEGLKCGFIRSFVDIDEPADILRYKDEISGKGLCKNSNTAWYINKLIDKYGMSNFT